MWTIFVLSVSGAPGLIAWGLTRLLVLFAIVIAAALSLFFAGYRNRRRPSGRAPLHIVVLYGPSGCSGAAAEGLNWDWP